MGTKTMGLAALLAMCAFATGASAAPEAGKTPAKKVTATAAGKATAKPKGARKTIAKKKAIVAKSVATPAPSAASDILAAANAESKPADAKPVEAKPAEAKPVEAKQSAPLLATKVTAANVAPSASDPVPGATLLPVTCKDGSKDPRCGRPMWGSGGTIGAGPAIHGTSGFPSTGEGFIDGNRLVVAVEMGSQFDDQGGIFGIDLTTGERSLLSGKLEDPARGPVNVGSGPDLGNVRAVTKAGSSWLALVSTGSTSPVSIIKIDPKSGARTLERTLDKGVLPSCTGSTAKLTVDFTSGIAGAPDGTAYVAVGNYSHAVGIVALKGASCTVVTMSGAGGFETKGAGPTIDSLDRYRSLKLDGGKLWALHGMSNSLMTIDLATGNRARISSGETSTKVGNGDAKLGYKMLAVAGSKVWTSGGWVSGGFTLTEAQASNGQRTASEAKAGPASYGDDITGVWVHPTKPLLVYSVDNSFALYDPATGNSALISE